MWKAAVLMVAAPRGRRREGIWRRGPLPPPRAGCAQRTEIAAPAPPRLPAPRSPLPRPPLREAAGGRGPPRGSRIPPGVLVADEGPSPACTLPRTGSSPPLRGQLLPTTPRGTLDPCSRDTVAVTRESQVGAPTSVSSAPVRPWPSHLTSLSLAFSSAGIPETEAAIVGQATQRTSHAAHPKAGQDMKSSSLSHQAFCLPHPTLRTSRPVSSSYTQRN